MLASPKSIGKFTGAIPQSNLGGGGYGTTYSSWLSTADVMTTAVNSILNTTNCTTAASQVDCLRNVPAASLVTGTVARYLVVDGTYLTSSSLILDGTGANLSNIHLMQGLMRDDGSTIISYIQMKDLNDSLTQVGFNSSLIASHSTLFPQLKSTNTSLDVFNVTSRVATDSIFRCIDQATAYASVLNNVFAHNQYFYEFNKSYQTTGWDPNPPVCDAPITLSRPNGDPDGEYFKCHSGELYYEFGNIVRQGLPLRDENDLPFSQFVLDSWASFARSYNPNPDRGILKARGYGNTSWALESAGEWQPVKYGNWSMRELQWPSLQVPFRDMERCCALGWPLMYFSPL
jgi:carboxylesterase type B